MSALEKRRAEVPAEVAQFLRLPGLGPKTAARIWRELDVTTLDGLQQAAEAAAAYGRSRVSAPRARRGSSRRSRRASAPASRSAAGLLGVGLPVVREIVAALREHPAAVEVSEAGSARRGRRRSAIST